MSETRVYGYARVSTQDQHLDLQIDALKRYGVEDKNLYMEKMTGTKKDRPQLDEMLKYVRPGDTIVVWKLDRIGRSLRHLMELVDHFKANDIHFVSLHENIDTSAPTGKLMFNIMASLAEFERDMIAERTRSGLESARARGRKGGRPSKDNSKVKQALKMYDSKQFGIPEITEATGVSKTSLYRYIKEREQKQSS